MDQTAANRMEMATEALFIRRIHYTRIVGNPQEPVKDSLAADILADLRFFVDFYLSVLCGELRHGGEVLPQGTAGLSEAQVALHHVPSPPASPVAEDHKCPITVLRADANDSPGVILALGLAALVCPLPPLNLHFRAFSVIPLPTFSARSAE